jgi:kindlin 2
MSEQDFDKNHFLFVCLKEEQYAKWMAAFRLASKGRSINETSYETERESILALLNMQIPSSNKSEIQPENYISTKFSKKYKPKQVSKF